MFPSRSHTPLLLLLLCLLLGLTLFSLYRTGKDITRQKEKAALQNSLQAVRTVHDGESAALHFLATNLTAPGGLLADSYRTGQTPRYALLESMGLAMEYALKRQDDQLFATLWRSTERYFALEKGSLGWRVNLETMQPEPVTALVDQLRIIKALVGAAWTFHHPAYRQAASLLAAAIVREESPQGCPGDYYDYRSHRAAEQISLFYIDPAALKIIRQLQPACETAEKKLLQILRQAPPANGLFLPTAYHYRQNKYIYSPQVNTVEALYTARAALAAGRKMPGLCHFLTNALINGDNIYNHYTWQGRPVGTDQSAAVYALAARFLQECGEESAAGLARQKLIHWQNRNGPLRGAFAWPDQNTAHTFDQLEALLSLEGFN